MIILYPHNYTNDLKTNMIYFKHGRSAFSRDQIYISGDFYPNVYFHRIATYRITNVIPRELVLWRVQ